jgi:hypothetical protein
MTAEEKQLATQQVLSKITTETYHFRDFINLVKFDTYLLDSLEFVSLMFDVGFKENIFDIPKKTGEDFFNKQLAIWKDKEFAKYSCRVHYILLTF